MSDGLSNRDQGKSARINVNQESERRDWAKNLGVSEDELKDAVHAAGNSPDKVRDYLQVKKFIGRLRDYVKRRRNRAAAG